MSKPARVIPKGAHIKKLIAEAGYSPEAFANEADISIKLVRRAIHSAPCTPQTISAIAKKLAKNHRGITFDDLIVKDPLSEGTAGDEADVPAELLTITVNVSVLGHPEIVKRHSKEEITEAFTMLLSEAASMTLKSLHKGSVILEFAVNGSGFDDLISAFVHGYLQRLGAYQLCFKAASEPLATQLVQWYLERHYFIDDGMTRRFQSYIRAGVSVQVTSTDNSLTISRFGLDHEVSSEDDQYVFDWELSSSLSRNNIEDAEVYWHLRMTPDLDQRDSGPRAPALLVDDTMVGALQPA